MKVPASVHVSCDGTVLRTVDTGGGQFMIKGGPESDCIISEEFQT